MTIKSNNDIFIFNNFNKLSIDDFCSILNCTKREFKKKLKELGLCYENSEAVNRLNKVKLYKEWGYKTSGILFRYIGSSKQRNGLI